MSLPCVTIISGVEKEQANPHDDDDHDDFEEVCIIIIIGIYRKSPSLKLATIHTEACIGGVCLGEREGWKKGCWHLLISLLYILLFT